MFQTIKFLVRILFIGLVFIMAVFLSGSESLAMGMEAATDRPRLGFFSELIKEVGI